MGSTIGPSVFFTGFTTAGVHIDGGHECLIQQAWFAECEWSDSRGSAYMSICLCKYTCVRGAAMLCAVVCCAALCCGMSHVWVFSGHHILPPLRVLFS